MRLDVGDSLWNETNPPAFGKKLITSPRGSAARVYATWNPLDKAAAITLSSGNLTETNNASTAGIVRATIGKASNKWYWEVTDNVSSATFRVGIANSSAGLTTLLGGDANGWAYSPAGNKVHLGNVVYGATYTIGDIIGIKLDMTAGTIEFLKNNVSQGVAFTGLTGTIYPAAGGSFSTTSSTANFGATTFTYSVPAGYNAGVYN
jgi:SPRY domain